MTDFWAKLSAYLSSGGAVVGGWILSSQAIALVGVLIGMGTFVVTWVYKHRADKLEREKFEWEKKRAIMELGRVSSD